MDDEVKSFLRISAQLLVLGMFLMWTATPYFCPFGECGNMKVYIEGYNFTPTLLQLFFGMGLISFLGGILALTATGWIFLKSVCERRMVNLKNHP